VGLKEETARKRNSRSSLRTRQECCFEAVGKPSQNQPSMLHRLKRRRRLRACQFLKRLCKEKIGGLKDLVAERAERLSQSWTENEAKSALHRTSLSKYDHSLKA